MTAFTILESLYFFDEEYGNAFNKTILRFKSKKEICNVNNYLKI